MWGLGTGALTLTRSVSRRAQGTRLVAAGLDALAFLLYEPASEVMQAYPVNLQPTIEATTAKNAKAGSRHFQPCPDRRRASRGKSLPSNHVGNQPANHFAKRPATDPTRHLGRGSASRPAIQHPSRRGIQFANHILRRGGNRGQIRAANRVQDYVPNHPGNRSGNGSPRGSRRVDSDGLDCA